MEIRPKLIHDTDAAEKMLFCWHEMELMTGLHLTLHDHIRAFIMPDNTCLLPNVNIHHNPCCDHPQRTRLKCGAHCRVEAMERAAAEGKPFRFQCWRGVVELVMPVYLGKVHAATVFAGAFRDPLRYPGAYQKILSQRSGKVKSVPLQQRPDRTDICEFVHRLLFLFCLI